MAPPLFLNCVHCSSKELQIARVFRNLLERFIGGDRQKKGEAEPPPQKKLEQTGLDSSRRKREPATTDSHKTPATRHAKGGENPARNAQTNCKGKRSPRTRTKATKGAGGSGRGQQTHRAGRRRKRNERTAASRHSTNQSHRTGSKGTAPRAKLRSRKHLRSGKTTTEKRVNASAAADKHRARNQRRNRRRNRRNRRARTRKTNERRRRQSRNKARRNHGNHLSN